MTANRPAITSVAGRACAVASLSILLTGCSPAIVGATALSTDDGQIVVRVVSCTGPLERTYFRLRRDGEPPVKATFAPVDRGQTSEWYLGIFVRDLELGVDGDRRYIFSAHSDEGASLPIYFSRADIEDVPSGEVLTAGKNGVPEVVDRDQFDKTACDSSK